MTSTLGWVMGALVAASVTASACVPDAPEAGGVSGAAGSSSTGGTSGTSGTAGDAGDAASNIDTKIEKGPASPSAESEAAFEFTTTGGVSFECRLDGGSFTACSSPFSYAELLNGSHIFEVRALDDAGGVDPTPAEWHWNVRRVFLLTRSVADPLVDYFREVVTTVHTSS